MKLIHVKGKCVIAVLDSFESIAWFKKQEIINMLYTSVTRPTHELLMVSLEKNEFSKKAADVINSMKKDGPKLDKNLTKKINFL